MFGYWPWIGLISIIVLLTAVMVIKWGDRLCQARLTPIDHSRLDQFGAQPEDFDMEMEDGNGTMVDFTLQEGSLHDSHGRDSRLTMDTSASGRREMAL